MKPQALGQVLNERDDGRCPDGDSGTLRAPQATAQAVASLSPTPALRNRLSLLLFVATCLWFWEPLYELWLFALREESFSHIVLIPCISGYLLVVKRDSILGSDQWSPALGLILLLIGALAHWSTGSQVWTPDHLATTIGTLVVLWWGIFLLSFGVTCFRQNVFALVFLVLMVPLPTATLSILVGFLQQSSAEAAAMCFAMLDIPVFRQGLVFHLSHLTIHVAEECSGIRSFLSLLVTGLLGGHWFLKLGWTKTVLVVLVVPLAIIKNAFRIVGLALLANYVDQTYVTNSLLHRAGGIPLFVLALVSMTGLVWVLRRCERRAVSRVGLASG
ncbi:MAG TPA: exosortase/archaeosortase family protein [Nitrospira sp.]|nr:exosortase/archaeosortase family protein [Nitrospira sp.]